MKRILVVVILIIFTHQAWSEANPTALVCDVSGKAQHRSEGAKDWSALAIFDQLEERAVLQLPEGATVELSFVHGGTQATLVGPCQVELQSEEPKLLAGNAKNVSLKRPAQRKGRLAPLGLNIDRMGGLVRPKPAEEPRWNTDAVVLGGPVRLSWIAPEEYSKFRVEFTDEDGELSIVEETAARTVTVESLAPDKVYLVRFCAWKGTQEDPDFEWEGSLESLGADLTDKLRQQPSSTPAEKSVLLSHYYANELYEPALTLCEELLKERPGDENLELFREYLLIIRQGRGL